MPHPSTPFPSIPLTSPSNPSSLPPHQPCFQHYNRPSPALLSSLRSHHLLPPAGLPLFHANWMLRRPPPVPLLPPGGPVSADVAADVAADVTAVVEAAGEGAAGEVEEDGFAGVRGIVGEDWVVVVALPPGAMLLDRIQEMVDEIIQDNWWHGRVVYFRGGMGVQEGEMGRCQGDGARALFSRALLLIAPPGEALDLILFMPPAAVVLEIQPSSHPSSSHRALSHSLSLRHHTLFCKLVNPGASEVGWTVREGVKYKWVVGPSTCPAPHVPEEIKAFEGSAKTRLEEAREKERLVKSQLKKNEMGGAAAEAEASKAAAAATEAAAAAAAAVDLSHPWLPFNASVFCERVGQGRRILFLGDSKQYQMVQVFVNHMAWGWKGKRKPAKELVNLEERPKACADALGGNAAKMGHEFCQW
ncbi:unnamed protein product [Closterium sp. Naga37s-1]|nr:unnamed protein product [Closterium sp. Naga37s-1]